MNLRQTLAGVACLGLMATALASSPAYAGGATCVRGVCTATASHHSGGGKGKSGSLAHPKGGGSTSGSNADYVGGHSSGGGGGSSAAGPTGPSAYDLAVQKANSDYAASMKTYAGCQAGAAVAGTSEFSCGAAPTRANVPVPKNATPAQKAAAAQAAAVPVITPQQAAMISVATALKIPTIKPGFGPSPDINRWHMAAVGYPYWLWADGTTTAAATNTVDGLTVSLSAKVTSTVYSMGDGHTLTCQGTGTPWRRGMEPAAKSPTCGYGYEEPSLPRGDYTITAHTHWAVSWTAGGQAGVINLERQSSIQMPVGELQAVITHG